MKRLTYNLKVGDVESWTVEGADNLTCDEICKRQEDDGCRTCPIEKVYNRLAQIENILGDDYDLDCLNELVKADRKEQEYMNIDEAIEHAKEISVTRKNNKCALEHSQLAEWLIQFKVLKSIISDNQDIIQLKNLIKADKEGRCVILPCKIGDIVYQITKNFISEFKVFYIEISTCENIFIHTHLLKGINMTGEVFPSTRIEKDLFLSYKEAEQAMKEREQNEKIK